MCSATSPKAVLRRLDDVRDVKGEYQLDEFQARAVRAILGLKSSEALLIAFPGRGRRG